MKQKKILKFNKHYPDGTKRKVLDLSLMKKLGWKSKISHKIGLKILLNGILKIISKY